MAVRIAPVRTENLRRCYELSSKRVMFGPDETMFGGYTGATLVNGTIQGHGMPPLGHAWVIEPDGEHVWEPGTATVYPIADFERLFSARVDVTYTVAEARRAGFEHETYGPWHETDSRGLMVTEDDDEESEG